MIIHEYSFSELILLFFLLTRVVPGAVLHVGKWITRISYVLHPDLLPSLASVLQVQLQAFVFKLVIKMINYVTLFWVYSFHVMMSVRLVGILATKAFSLESQGQDLWNFAFRNNLHWSLHFQFHTGLISLADLELLLGSYCSWHQKGRHETESCIFWVSSDRTSNLVKLYI